MMDQDKMDALAAAGYVANDFKGMLDISPAEEAIIKIRLGIRDAVRRRRKDSGMTQAELAKAMGTSQARVATIETVTVGVSMELMLKALYTLGGTLADLDTPGGLASCAASKAIGQDLGKGASPGKLRGEQAKLADTPKGRRVAGESPAAVGKAKGEKAGGRAKVVHGESS